MASPGPASSALFLRFDWSEPAPVLYMPRRTTQQWEQLRGMIRDLTLGVGLDETFDAISQRLHQTLGVLQGEFKLFANREHEQSWLPISKHARPGELAMPNQHVIVLCLDPERDADDDE